MALFSAGTKETQVSSATSGLLENIFNLGGSKDVLFPTSLLNFISSYLPVVALIFIIISSRKK